ncbi:hypothetical protein F3Y22_tig00000340pilonHSYRG00621 [Hibiscus syriacus]|uniref:Uncharacterized protein n=1 Tax=Hibiscus syriacus TaxID=106335 RepID=A0A6A3D1E5_HIBSY|nr:hypothetical protein F3Y22_tig00000340pilonHSYRG00621 [Hibiscus syriacus]
MCWENFHKIKKISFISNSGSFVVCGKYPKGISLEGSMVLIRSIWEYRWFGSKVDAERDKEKLNGFVLNGFKLSVHFEKSRGLSRVGGHRNADMETRRCGGFIQAESSKEAFLRNLNQEQEQISKMSTVCSVREISFRLHKWGLKSIKVQRIGGKVKASLEEHVEINRDADKNIESSTLNRDDGFNMGSDSVSLQLSAGCLGHSFSSIAGCLAFVREMNNLFAVIGVVGQSVQCCYVPCDRNGVAHCIALDGRGKCCDGANRSGRPLQLMESSLVALLVMLALSLSVMSITNQNFESVIEGAAVAQGYCLL